ncbi:lengsin isoform X2 [Hyperolius riggenbachi]|uniref:lengsin isoform X2 n=1 Tax=Hyperolius riggenbachi TaxID=752182 RepID=UPI0035A2E63F
MNSVPDGDLNHSEIVMDNERYKAKEPGNTDSDEVDGSVISRFRRRKGVKVTGRYVPPLEWEKVHATHSDERRGSAQTEHRGDDTSKTEQEKQRMELLVSTQASDAKNVEDMSQEKIDKKTSSKAAVKKSDDDVLPRGSGIPKETLEELKNILKESPLIHHKNRWNPKTSTTITEIRLPKPVVSTRDKSTLTFETFQPHLGKQIQKPQPMENVEAKQPHEMLIDSILQEPLQAQKDEQSLQPNQPFNGNQILLPDQLSVASGSRFDTPTNTFKDSMSASGKDDDHSDSKIPNSLHLISHIEQIKQQIAREDIRFVRFEASDLHGVSRSKTVPARFFQEKAENGICMPRSYLELSLELKENGVDHISSKQFNGDILLKPDLQTFRVLPWAEKTARVICDSLSFLGNPLPTSPRYLAKHLLSQLQESGFLLKAAFVYEFCVFGVAEIVNSKTVSLSAATLLSDHQSFMQELFDGLYYIGGNIESFSPSSAPGQMEVSFHPEYGLAAADNAFTFKTAIKEAAKKQGYIASFFTDSVGFYNSGLLSHSLWDLSGTRNVFDGGSGTEGLTDLGKQWLSGLLLHSAALSCLVAPVAACRKRFLKDDKDSRSSISVTWGSNDHNCIYNIKPYGCHGPYIENKLCSATANPYLVLAATIAAGLDGVRRGLNLLGNTNSSSKLSEMKVPSVPVKLENALSALEEDTYMRRCLGEPFIKYFMAMKHYELETDEGDAERNKFLEYFI